MDHRVIGPGPPAESRPLVVLKRLHDFALRVHHKRSVLDDGLSDGSTLEHQEKYLIVLSGPARPWTGVLGRVGQLNLHRGVHVDALVFAEQTPRNRRCVPIEEVQGSVDCAATSGRRQSEAPPGFKSQKPHCDL